MPVQILDPQKDGKKKRLIVIGKKKVPSHRERFFGFVQTVDDDVKKLTGGMGEESHETANGTRHTEASRIAAEGLPKLKPSQPTWECNPLHSQLGKFFPNQLHLTTQTGTIIQTESEVWILSLK